MSASSYGIERRIRHLTSAQNASVKKLRALLEGLDKTRTEFAFEGDTLLSESLRSNIKLTTVFLTETRLNSENLPELNDFETDIISIPDSLFRNLVSTEAPQGIAAIAERPHFDFNNCLMNSTPLLLVAAAIQDPGNFGTLIRSAEAFGATGVLALPGTVSAWNQKALRASAGSTFRLPVVEVTVAQVEALKKRGIRIYAAVAGDVTEVRRVPLQGPSAILIGNEGAGLSPELVELADSIITVPSSAAVESLNAAVAGSILLYEAWQMRKGVSQ
jgi:RNA methyltransferase, TrmH family